MSLLAIARQPIVDAALRVTAYELFFRAPGTRDATSIADSLDLASSRLMLSGFVDGGPEDIVDGKLAFINVTQDVLSSGAAALLPRELVVLEVPYDGASTNLGQIMASVVKDGFRLALDNFAWQESANELLPHCAYAKLNVRSLSREAIRENVERLAKNRHLSIVAACVESREEFEFCRGLGIQEFQGYFMCRPTVVARRDLPGPRLGVMRLLSEIWNSEADKGNLERIIRQDATLTYRLIRVANSPYYNRGSVIRSVKHALSILGLDGTRQWISLLSMSQMDDKPHELLAMSLLRARMCESLGRMVGDRDLEGFFLVGLFSALDALMDQPMADLVERLNLNPIISDALLHHSLPDGGGVRGRALACVLAQEQGKWDEVKFMAASLRDIQACYLEAIRWSRSVGGLI
jgi:EAL and modified HD-GYP domain-containing signal transduction protein